MITSILKSGIVVCATALTTALLTHSLSWPPQPAAVVGPAAEKGDRLLAPARYVVLVRDGNGNEWIAGDGRTCADAWTRSVMPAEWTAVVCVQEDTL